MGESAKLEELDAIVRRLAGQRSPAIQFITFLRDIADNESRWQKYRSSYAGNVINLHIVSAENSLILLCCRIWDDGKDVHSLKRAIGLLRRCELELTERRKKDIDFEFVRDWSIRRKENFQRISDEYSRLVKMQIHDVLKVMRNENLAHLLDMTPRKAERFPDGFENHGVTRYDLYDFAEASVRLIEEIHLYSDGLSYSFSDSSRLFRNYCEAYWDAMPIFRDVKARS